MPATTPRTNPFFQDGDYGSAQIIERGAPDFPFAYLGDVTTRRYTHKFIQLRAKFVATAGGTADPEDASGKLIGESKPIVIGPSAQGPLCTFYRTYAYVPTTQTDASRTIMVTRPTLPANVTYDMYHDGVLARAGAGLLYSTTHLCDYSSQTSYDIYEPIEDATSSAKSPPTSGTWSFTYKASTTAALNWNDSTATIQAAINALADMVADGITATVNSNLTGGNMQITIAPSGAWDANPPTINGAGLGPADARIVDAWRSSATVWLFTTRTHINRAAHGLVNTGQKLVIRSLRLLALSASLWSVYDANTILVATNQFTGGTAGTVDAIAQFIRVYTPGSAPIPCTVVTRFSLTPIAPDPYQGEGDAFIQAIFAGDSTINYRIGDASRWPDDTSPIVSLATTIIDAADL